jgi:hypothetical protein
MIDKFLISENASIGQKQYWHEDDEGNVTIQTVQDISAIVEANKRAYNQVDEKANWKGEVHQIGSIPLSIFYNLRDQGILGDQKRMKAWLNDPANQVFRTRPGRV